MPLLFSIPFSGQEIIQALNWTLIHSLWQGMLLSMVAGSIVFFTKKSSPSLRYNLLVGALFVFVITISATFRMQVIKAKHVANTAIVVPAVKTSAMENAAISPLAVESNSSLNDKAGAFFTANAYWIVLTWLLIIGLQFIRLTAGLYGIYQLKRREVFSAGEYWNRRIAELRRQLQINKRVKLLQSGLAEMPAVIGYFKPVILFPAAMLASLPASEIEGILMHELAHIRRKDFLVNMLQHMVEIIFFFNPAVLWVSSLIKQERENCCDDIALSQTGSKQNYIKALLSFQGFNVYMTSPLINAFSGEKNHLMNRVKRIIYNNNKTLNNMEKKFLVTGMIITSVFIFAFSSNNVQPKGIEKKDVSQPVNITPVEKIFADLPAPADTIPIREQDMREGSTRKISTSVNGRKYIIVSENNEVKELYVNSKKIPAEKMGDYKNITGKILRQSKADMEQSDQELRLSEIDMEQSKTAMEQSKMALAQSGVEMENAKKEMQEHKEEMSQAMEEAKKDMAKSKIEMEQAQKQMKEEMEQSQKTMQQSKMEMEQAQKQMKEEMGKSKKEMELSMIAMEQSKKAMLQSQIMQENIIGDLIKENIIKAKKDLASYKLSNEELIVNGVKQPDTIYKRFKEKYVKNNKFTMMYNNNDAPDK
ncbi:MAG: M56 family metallopeptidase [Ferruginibacter sp.]